MMTEKHKTWKELREEKKQRKKEMDLLRDEYHQKIRDVKAGKTPTKTTPAKKSSTTKKSSAKSKSTTQSGGKPLSHVHYGLKEEDIVPIEQPKPKPIKIEADVKKKPRARTPKDVVKRK